MPWNDHASQCLNVLGWALHVYVVPCYQQLGNFALDVVRLSKIDVVLQCGHLLINLVSKPNIPLHLTPTHSAVGPTISLEGPLVQNCAHRDDIVKCISNFFSRALSIRWENLDWYC